MTHPRRHAMVDGTGSATSAPGRHRVFGSRLTVLFYGGSPFVYSTSRLRLRPRSRRPLARLAVGFLAAVAVTGTGLVGGPAAQAAGGTGPRSAAAESSQAVQPLSATRTALVGWWSAARGDNFLSGTYAEDQSARDAGYQVSRREGAGLETQDPGTVPLYLFWNAARGDNFSTATQAGYDSAIAAGYVSAGIEAYIYPNRVGDTVPLYQYWSAGRQDNFATATQEGRDSAVAAGYSLVRIEGYVFP